jgi:hypothetical protein
MFQLKVWTKWRGVAVHVTLILINPRKGNKKKRCPFFSFAAKDSLYIVRLTATESLMLSSFISPRGLVMSPLGNYLPPRNVTFPLFFFGGGRMAASTCYMSGWCPDKDKAQAKHSSSQIPSTYCIFLDQRRQLTVPWKFASFGAQSTHSLSVLRIPDQAWQRARSTVLADAETKKKWAPLPARRSDDRVEDWIWW